MSKLKCDFDTRMIFLTKSERATLICAPDSIYKQIAATWVEKVKTMFRKIVENVAKNM